MRRTTTNIAQTCLYTTTIYRRATILYQLSVRSLEQVGLQDNTQRRSYYLYYLSTAIAGALQLLLASIYLYILTQLMSSKARAACLIVTLYVVSVYSIEVARKRVIVSKNTLSTRLVRKWRQVSRLQRYISVGIQQQIYFILYSLLLPLKQRLQSLIYRSLYRFSSSSLVALIYSSLSILILAIYSQRLASNYTQLTY